MVTLSQRIEELRTEKGLSRPALSSALGFPRNAVEKFETGRQTPTREQQDKMADFFGVSVFYLKGESNDRTRQENWMDGDFVDDEVVVSAPRKVSKPVAKAQTSTGEQATVFDSIAGGKAFQEALRGAVLDVLRSPEGQALLTQAIRKELSKNR